jgi:tetratricopeptide (TPR) repeat protein
VSNAPGFKFIKNNTVFVLLLIAVLVTVAPSCKKVQLGKGNSPEETELSLQRGAQALEDGRYNDAIADLHDVVDARPNDTNSRYNLGVALQRVKSYRESIEVLTTWGDNGVEVRKIGQKIKVPVDADGDYLYALGTSYQEMRQLDEAQQCFNVSVGEFPNHLQSRYARAMVLQQRGKLREAQSAWTDYLQRDPYSAWADGARRHLATVDQKLTETAQP